MIELNLKWFSPDEEPAEEEQEVEVIDVPDVPGIGGVLSVYVEDGALRAKWSEIKSAADRAWVIALVQVEEGVTSVHHVTQVSVVDGAYIVLDEADSQYEASSPDEQPVLPANELGV